MTPAEAFAACESTVRRVDPDRYVSTLFAPADKRPLLFALYAFNHEIARANEGSAESPTCEIRLQWWRETIDDAQRGRPRAHPIAVALSEVFSRTPLTFAGLNALTEARETEIPVAPFATLSDMESHAEATSSALMRMAVVLLDAIHDATDLTHDAGIAYGLVGILRSIPFHATRGRLFLPQDLLAKESVTVTDVLAGKCSAALRRVVDKVRACAMRYFVRAQTIPLEQTIFPAILPAAMVPAYNARLSRADLLRVPSRAPQIRRQFILLRAAFRRRL